MVGKTAKRRISGPVTEQTFPSVVVAGLAWHLAKIDAMRRQQPKRGM